MQQCELRGAGCPTLTRLEFGLIVDKRPTDACPDFPSEFSYSKDFIGDQ